jgi:hypothetical protein
MRQRGLLITILLVLLGAAGPAAVAQSKLGHLKEWIGKHPTYNDFKPRREFLKLPEIKRPLLNLLSRDDYRFLTRTCGKEVPIEMIGDFLIARRCHRYACGNGGGVVIINLSDGAIHVAIMDEDDREQRWFSANGKHKELPFNVQFGFLLIKK